MKKIAILLMLILLKHTSLQACDICGCNNGGSFMGILPQSHMQLLGIRYGNKSFDSHLSSEYLKTTENFQSLELIGRFYPVKRLQLLTFVPYSQNSQQRHFDDFSTKKEGIGDVSLFVHYNLINTFIDTLRTAKFDHNLLLGTGIKAPLGDYKYDRYNLSEVANSNFQLGTGSWDFPISVIYTLKKASSGLNLNLSHKINGINSLKYKFANQTQVNLMAFRSIAFPTTSMMLSVGINSEFKQQDKFEGVRNEFTGGWYANVAAGLDYYVGKYGLGLNAQLPVWQNLSGGELKLKESFYFSIFRMF